MTYKSWWLVAVIVAILAGVAYLVFWHDAQTPASGAATYDWRFSDKGEQDGIPHTQVVLVANGKSYTIGTYEGTCAPQDGDYMPYEVSKVICWFAGGGHEVGVFEEPGQVVVRVGDVDEGASGVPGFRGNFVLAQTIQ